MSANIEICMIWQTSFKNKLHTKRS